MVQEFSIHSDAAQVFKAASLSVALVGCGRIAQRHAELLATGQISGAFLAGVCDINQAKADYFGTVYDVPHFYDMHFMMRHIQPDVVVVLTESGRHSNHVVQLAPYGAHVVVEKPMALGVADADRMIYACETSGAKLFVVKQNRFNVPVACLRQAVERGRFGRLVLGTVRVRWCRRQSYYDQDEWRGTKALDGGVLSNQASHHIDMLLWMMGDVDSVYAETSTRLAKMESEDTAVVTLKFASGALGVIEATTGTRPSDLEGSISILGESGSVEIAGFAVNKIRTWRFEEETYEDEITRETMSENPPNVYGFGHKAFYDHIVRSIANDGPNLIGGLEGRRSVELLEAIYESARLREPVDLKIGKSPLEG